MIIPFGKYQNSELTTVFNCDKQYLRWLATQPWFAIKYTDLYNNYNILLKNQYENIVENRDNLIIYTDGACSHNGNKEKAKAGIGVYFSENNFEKYDNISKRLDIELPTNNKAELYAILESLRKTKNTQYPTTIYTDSQYSINAISLWYPEWIKNNNLDKKKNINILKMISEEIQNRSVTFKHIKGHSKEKDVHSIGNNKADNLATSCL